jgi:sulfonate transport system substrate-binding protein
MSAALTRRAWLGVLATTAAAWSAASRAAGDELRIGFQKSSLNLLVARRLGLVDKRLPGTKITWIEFPAGPQLLEALAVGGLDVGMTGDSPPVFAQAAGKDLLYVGAEPPKPDASTLLVRADSPLRTLAEIKGRRIALQKGSSAHFLLVQAVAKAGLQWADIAPVYLAPADARAAFERGAVDAWAIWDPYYAAAEIDSQARVLATSRGLTSNNSVYLASRALATARPQALRALFGALTEADAWAQAHRKETAQLFAETSGLGLATVHRFLARRQPSPVAPLSPAVLAEQQKVADAFAALGLIPKPIRVADIVWQPQGNAS